jgi:hypothetical protein
MDTFNLDNYYGNKKAYHFRQARRFAMNNTQAAGPLWEFRWSPVDTTQLCAINRISLKALQNANATAEELRFNLKVARTFTAIDNTNVASILRSGDMQQLTSAFPASVLSNFVESSSATAASGGTYTLDTDPMAVGAFVSIATASTTVTGGGYQPVFDYCPQAGYEQPLCLKASEGWTVNLEVAKGATVGVVLFLEVAWTELQ